MTKISEKEIEAAVSAWSRALTDAPDESVYERRRRCIYAALSAAARVREEDNAREPAMSVEAPERIWIESEGGCPYFYHEEELSAVDCPVTGYVRSDKLKELLKKQEELTAEVEHARDGNRYAHLERIAIKRAEKAEAQLAELEAENKRLKGALEIVIGIGGIAEGNATINYMVSIARRALEGGGNAVMV